MNTTSRTGKIARLPREIRQELNERLSDGEAGASLVTWLNGLPEVQAVLNAEFEGAPIREQNVSEWRKGGYVDWKQEEKALELAVRLGERAERWHAEGRPSMTETLAIWLIGQFLVATEEIVAAEGEKKWQLLNKMCSNLAKLHRIEQQARKWRLDQGSSTHSSSGPKRERPAMPQAEKAQDRKKSKRAEAAEFAQDDDDEMIRTAQAFSAYQAAKAAKAKEAQKATVKTPPSASESGGHGIDATASTDELTDYAAAEEARLEALDRAQQGLEKWSTERLARFGVTRGSAEDPILTGGIEPPAVQTRATDPV